MKIVRRTGVAPVLIILSTILLGAAGAPLAHAAGYWTCDGGTWVPVGGPPYPAPLKKCGAQLERPRTQTACEQAGGRWGPAGLFPRPICRMPTHDAGRPCGDVSECEGLCLAALTPEQRDLLVRPRDGRRKLEMVGTCTPHSSVFGCMAIVEKGFVSGIQCRD